MSMSFGKTWYVTREVLAASRQGEKRRQGFFGMLKAGGRVYAVPLSFPWLMLQLIQKPTLQRADRIFPQS